MANDSSQKKKLNIGDEPFEIDCYNINKLVEVNKLQPITNPIYLDIGNNFTSDGLFSNQIFGRSKEDRSTIFAYIDLKSYFIQPLAYITLKKIFSKLDDLLMREAFFKVGPKGYLVQATEDDGGETGIEFLYKNWGKIKFERNNSMIRNNRIKFIESLKKDEFFIDKWLVIPPFYRDVKFGKNGRVVATDKVNDLYVPLISMSKVMERERESKGLHAVATISRFKMQTTLVQIYKFFTSPPNLSKKFGIIRSSLLGKNIDYSVRLVISAPTYDQDRWDEVPVKFDRCGIPLGALVVLFYPFFQNWFMSYFKKEFVDRQYNYPYYREGKGIKEELELDNPEGYFTADYIDKQLKSFVHSYGDRFRLITVPTKKYGFIPVEMVGKLPEGTKVTIDDKLIKRKLTWTDLIYRAAVEITQNRTVVVTRYPLEDYFGVSGFRVHVLSTINTTPLEVNGKFYTHYPLVDTRMNQSEVSIQFVNTLIMANCFLGGYGADYDGDQVTVKGNFTDEANKEMLEFTKSKKNILTIGGDSNRSVINEALQAIYSLTID